MRIRHLSLVVATAACTGLLLAGRPATAQAEQHAPAPAKGCVAEGSTGLYLSKEGSATLSLSKEFTDGLKSKNITLEAIAPLTLSADGTQLTMPIGEKYDNIELPSGRVCYPGGVRMTNAATSTVYELEDFWIKFAAIGNSKSLATPKVNGTKRAAGELNMANFTVSQAFMTGQFVPHNDGLGPRRVEFTLDSAWARDMNTALGTNLTGGSPWATLDIAWRGAPTKLLPSLNTSELMGLKLFADALGLSAGSANSPANSPANSTANSPANSAVNSAANSATSSTADSTNATDTTNIAALEAN